MPTIKIYPPAQLPEKKLTETQFNIWKEELEVYISQEKCFKIFLPGQPYQIWQSAEEYSDRIRRLNEPDLVRANADRTNEEALIENEEKLADLRVNLRTVLAIVGKCVSEGHYNSVVRHSTSLQWIYDTIRSDYNIQTKGIHFLNVIDLNYDSEIHTPVSFYNEYRTLVVNNLARAGDVLKYKNNENLENDEKMSPMIEDLVLLNVISKIDSKLPAYVKRYYNHKMNNDERLMDFKSDILVNIPSFISNIENSELNGLNSEASLNAFKRTFVKKTKRPYAQPQLYCRMCWLAKLPKDIYSSHNIGDDRCSQLSYQDKQKLKSAYKLNAFKNSAEEDNLDEDIALQFGYNDKNDDESSNEEVKSVDKTLLPNQDSPRTEESSCGLITPIQSQILTVFVDEQNKTPLHIELDSGASINYCREKEALQYGFRIKYCKQISRLGDGFSKIESIGEIKETFYRNNWKVEFRAAVCKSLSAPFIGGTVFLKENGIEQDFVNNVIKLLKGSITVQPTHPISLLPTEPIFSNTKVKQNIKMKTLTFDTKWLLPGQELTVSLPDKMKNEEVIAVQPCEDNTNPNWPEPELKHATNGNIQIVNNSSHPIHLGKEVKRCKLIPTENPNQPCSRYYEYEAKLTTFKGNENEPIKTDHIKCTEAKELIVNAHRQYEKVFNKDLTEGYNNFYGKHECSLNWASSERPVASKAQVPSYDHEMKVLQQEVMDEL